MNTVFDKKECLEYGLMSLQQNKNIVSLQVASGLICSLNDEHYN